MTRSIGVGASEVWAFVTLVDLEGAKASGASASSIAIQYQVDGAAPSEPLALVDSADPAWAALKWYELGGGDYRVGLPASVAQSGNLGKSVRLFGTYSGGDLHGETLVIDQPEIGQGTEIVTIIVQDAADPLQKVQGILVSAFSSGVLADRRRSNASGVLTMHLNPGRYPLSAATPGLWQMADAAQAIDVEEGGVNSFTVGMNFMPISPPPLDKAIGWIRAIDEKGQGKAGVEATIVVHQTPDESDANGTGTTIPATPWTVASGANGMIEYGPTEDALEAGLIGNWIYRIWGPAVGLTEADGAYFRVPMSAVNDPNGFPIRSFIRRPDA